MELASREASDRVTNDHVLVLVLLAAMELASREASDQGSVAMTCTAPVLPQWSWPLARPATAQEDYPL